MELNWTTLTEGKLSLEKESDTFGKFVVEPLTPGYGITLGNSLRRVLLNSLQGAALCRFRCEGVLHEMTSIPGVIEDVTEVILNLKAVRLALPDGAKDIGLTLSAKATAKGERQVTAADLQVPAGVTVLNPETHILTLSAKASVEIELEASTGRGYAPAEENKDPEKAVDWVAIDSIYTPIRRVSYNVTDARVGQRTDYDKLTLEVTTDGGVSPRDAVAFAAKILKTQLQVFINFEEAVKGEVAEQEGDPTDEWNEHLFRTIDELDLSVRSANCLQNADIRFVYELVERSDTDLLRTKNFGRKSLLEIQSVLDEHELELGMRLPRNFPRKR